jgi:hypothetical protein
MHRQWVGSEMDSPHDQFPDLKPREKGAADVRWMQRQRMAMAIDNSLARLRHNMDPWEALKDQSGSFQIARAGREFSSDRKIDGWLATTASRFAFMSAAGLAKHTLAWQPEDLELPKSAIGRITVSAPSDHSKRLPRNWDPDRFSSVILESPGRGRMIVELAGHDGHLVFRIDPESLMLVHDLDDYISTHPAD